MKFLKLILLLNLITILSSCGTVKKAFTNQKKISGDEFLVEKKSPLVMPPDYNQLPTPENNKKVTEADSSDVKKLLANQDREDTASQSNKPKNENLVKTILEKIKKN
tara:strand:+ start:389 stop:709 length:321 start_codon:yes stop_codon:yes gene_type:complete